MAPFGDLLSERAVAVEATLKRLLPSAEGPEARLIEAMNYAVFAGGKRLRPFLVTASAELFGVSMAAALRVAAAVELVHTYSLIHDDLPCMDNDDLRRGKPTVHIAFDEATAILAGDAMLTLAFEILAAPETHSLAEVRCELVTALSQAAGWRGMVAGQMIDLQAEYQTMEPAGITRMQRLKTGALLALSCEAGAILGRAPEPLRHALHAYAHDLGLAFQITDDLLDARGDGVRLGKRTGKDGARGKATLVAALGEERARLQADMLAQQAMAHLEPFAEKAEIMRQVADFVVHRDH